MENAATGIGVGAVLVLWILLVILAVMWICLPFFLLSRLKQIQEQIEGAREEITKATVHLHYIRRHGDISDAPPAADDATPQ